MSAAELDALGLIASKTGRFSEARDWYQQRLAAEPNNPEAYLAVGVLIWDHLHGHKEITGEQRKQLADEGIKVLEGASKVAPNAPNPYTYTNLLYRERAEAAATEEERRADVETANELFKKAAALQKPTK